MAFKNYISVSVTSANKDININGTMFMTISGKFTMDGIKKHIVDFIQSEYGKTIKPDDIAIAGISEISKRLFKRLVK